MLRDKGSRYILEVCRSLYGFAAKKRHLPPYADNPFAGLGGKRFCVEDAKKIFVFDADSELAFLKAADPWAFPVHFTLAKTGVRPGEVIHLLIEDVDLANGWMHICNKAELGWRIKTRRERAVPLVEELVTVLGCVIGTRSAGPVFLREQFDARRAPLAGADRTATWRALPATRRRPPSGPPVRRSPGKAGQKSPELSGAMQEPPRPIEFGCHSSASPAWRILTAQRAPRAGDIASPRCSKTPTWIL